MDLRQLEYFAAVARHRNFTRAAEELYVTQPALSQQVRRLERELGLELLTRTSAGVDVTAAGQELLARAESILAEVGRAHAAMDEHAGVTRGFVRLATAPGAARWNQRTASSTVVHGAGADTPGSRAALSSRRADSVTPSISWSVCTPAHPTAPLRAATSASEGREPEASGRCSARTGGDRHGVRGSRGRRA